MSPGLWKVICHGHLVASWPGLSRRETIVSEQDFSHGDMEMIKLI